jgi:L-serine dehydratase
VTLSADTGVTDPLHVVEWVNLYALAVNEENAAGGRIVTAPTNGAAGIVPAVLHYYVKLCPGRRRRRCGALPAGGGRHRHSVQDQRLDLGCGGRLPGGGRLGLLDGLGRLCEVMGGTPEQVENAAEIGIEHNLGLTCDPVGGLVQIPCIERNAIASDEGDQRRTAVFASATAATRCPSTRPSRRCATPDADMKDQVQGDLSRRTRCECH